MAFVDQANLSPTGMPTVTSDLRSSMAWHPKCNAAASCLGLCTDDGRRQSQPCYHNAFLVADAKFLGMQQQSPTWEGASDLTQQPKQSNLLRSDLRHSWLDVGNLFESGFL